MQISLSGSAGYTEEVNVSPLGKMLISSCGFLKLFSSAVWDRSKSESPEVSDSSYTGFYHLIAQDGLQEFRPQGIHLTDLWILQLGLREESVQLVVVWRGGQIRINSRSFSWVAWVHHCPGESYNTLGKSAIFIITDIKMSTDTVEQSDAQAEQAGKDNSPFNYAFECC